MSELKIRDRLVGGWRLMGYEVTADGKTDHPLGENPRGAILYTPDGYMSAQLAGPGPYKDDDRPDAYYIAYSGPYDVDETSHTVNHHVQVSVIPSWLGTTQHRHARFDGPDKLTLSVSEPGAGGVTITQTISWARQPPQ
jgi:Lipocalin-like domain